jgi:hypothetical protein
MPPLIKGDAARGIVADAPAVETHGPVCLRTEGAQRGLERLAQRRGGSPK